MAAAHEQPAMTKRKVDESSVEQQGEAAERTAEDVEMGEVVEGKAGEGLVGDEWEEVITGGKVLKMRKVEGEQS